MMPTLQCPRFSILHLSAGSLLTLGGLVFAQPEFTTEQFFSVGDSGKVGFAIKTTAFEDYLDATGSDHVWDFSGESWAAPSSAYSMREAASTGRPAFASSLINEYALATMARDVYYSFSEDEDTVFLDGLMSGGSAYAYKPRIPYLTFPLVFDESDSTSVTQFALPTQPTNATGSVRRWWHFDGYGTVKLPYGDVEAVTRIYTHQVDSSYVINTGTHYEELIWFRNEGGLPLLRIVKQGTAVAVYYASLDDQTPIRFARGMRLRTEQGRALHYMPDALWPSRLLPAPKAMGERVKVYDGLGRIRFR